jgi:hypothetical protein
MYKWIVGEKQSEIIAHEHDSSNFSARILMVTAASVQCLNGFGSTDDTSPCSGKPMLAGASAKCKTESFAIRSHVAYGGRYTVDRCLDGRRTVVVMEELLFRFVLESHLMSLSSLISVGVRGETFAV